MSDIVVRCASNNGDGHRNVVTFEPTYQENEEQNTTATVSLTIVDTAEDADVGAEYTVGSLYSVTLTEAGGADDDPYAKLQALNAEVAAIQNSTNTPGYKTPAELKRPPLLVPDGVVTSPRPSVSLRSVTDVPPEPQAAPKVGGGAGAAAAPAHAPTPTPAPRANA